MSYPMRRKDRQQDEQFCLDLMDRCSHGTLALTTGEDTPYCLPLSFVRKDRSLYFHCARVGRKTDLLRSCPRVCVTFVGQDDPTYISPDNNFTTHFASAIVCGTAVEVTDREEMALALELLCRKLLPAAMTGDNFPRAVEHSLAVTAVWRIDLDEMSGKLR